MEIISKWLWLRDDKFERRIITTTTTKTIDMHEISECNHKLKVFPSDGYVSNRSEIMRLAFKVFQQTDSNKL